MVLTQIEFQYEMEIVLDGFFVNKRFLKMEKDFKKNKDLSNIETKNSLLRDMVCSKIKSEKDKYTNNVYYEDDFYKNLDDRIRKMERSGEFVDSEVEVAKPVQNVL